MKCGRRVADYRSDGETRLKELLRPFGVRRGEGFPDRRRKSSWSIWKEVVE
jgi:hypothetical protein